MWAFLTKIFYYEQSYKFFFYTLLLPENYYISLHVKSMSNQTTRVLMTIKKSIENCYVKCYSNIKKKKINK